MDACNGAGTSSKQATAAGSSAADEQQGHKALAVTKDRAAAMPALPPRNCARSSVNAAGTRTVTVSNNSSSTNGPNSNGQPASGAGSKAGAGSRSSSQKALSAVRGMPSLPARVAGSGISGTAGVIDPEESESTQQLRSKVHNIRVQLIRAARRLGYEHDNGLVKQVLYRLYLAEKLKEPFRKGSRRPDAALLAARDAARLEEEQGSAAPLGLSVTILVIGLRGTGKTQLIRSLLSMGSRNSSSSNDGASSSSSSSPCPSSIPLDAFSGETKRVTVARGCVLGVGFTLVDTPGLTASAAGTAANAAVLRGVKKAFKQYQPDLVLYVDRFDQPTRAGGELPVLQAVTNTCGPAVWLNTIVALTHAGSLPPGGSQGQLSWDTYSQQRSQLLQLIIRSASGDARLMNPIAFAESHPGCRRNSQGQPVIPSGLAWQQHMLVLIISAKLLADAEAALQMTPDASAPGSSKLGAGGALDAASMRQLMGRPDGPPVRYLMTQLTGFSQPLTYPDHQGIMELRSAKKQLHKLKGWRRRKEVSRQIRFRLLQMSQTLRRQQRTSDLLCKATRAGGKLQLAQPRTATRVKPSVQPPVGHRYRALEPSAGWIVRPHIEPHGMDNSDGVEGFLAEKNGVMRPGGPEQLLSGAPYRISSSANAGKEQILVQGRAEMSLYHDLPGLATTTLAADLQTSGTSGTPDMLMVLRLDTQRRGFPLAANSPSAGILLSQLAQECRPLTGPLATGVRLQDCLRLRGPGGAPVELDMALGRMFCSGGLERDDNAWGGNAEMRTDARQLLGSRYSCPLSLSGSVMGHRGETMAAVSAALQVQRGRRSGVGAKMQLNNRGVATMALQVRSDKSQWLGLVGLLPLANLALEKLSARFGTKSNDKSGSGGSKAGAQEAAAAAVAAAMQQQQQQQSGSGSHIHGSAS